MPILIVEKFTGGLHDPSVTSSVQLDPSDCSEALNVEFYPRGSVSQREGYFLDTLSGTCTSATTSATSAFIKLYRWKTGSTDYHIGVTCVSGTGATAWSATIGTLDLTNKTYTALVSAWDDEEPNGNVWIPEYDDVVDTTAYAGSAFLTFKDHAGAPFSFNGTVCSAQTTIPSGCACIAGFGNYLFVSNILHAGLRKGSRIRWNSAGDIATWPEAYYIDLDPDDADEITCTKLLGDYLVVFKKRKIFLVYWVGGTLLFKEARRAVNVGCVGPNAAVEHEGKVIFLATDGAYTFDGTTTKEISKKIRPLFQNVNPNYIHMAEVFKYLSRKQIWFCVPYNVNATTTAVKNYVFVWDYELDNWTKFDLSISAIADFVDAKTWTYGDFFEAYYQVTRPFQSFATVGATKTYFGTLGGTVHQYGDGAADDGGTAIQSRWQSMWIDFGDPLLNKRIRRMTLLLDKKVSGNLLVGINENWDSTPVADTNLSWTGTQSASLTGTTDAELIERRIDATHQARALQLDLSGDSSGSPWSLHKILIDYVQKGRTFVS